MNFKHAPSMTTRDLPICALRLSVVLWISAVVFTFAPRVDDPTSRVFFDPVRGFWMAQEGELLAVRETIWAVCLLAVTIVAIIWLAPRRLYGHPVACLGLRRCAAHYRPRHRGEWGAKGVMGTGAARLNF
jgi:hypothetical protein